MPFPGAGAAALRETEQKAGLGALRILLALRESEAATTQLSSLGCVSGGPRDPKPAHLFRESPGPLAGPVVKCGNGPPNTGWISGGQCGRGQASSPVFMPDICILTLNLGHGAGGMSGHSICLLSSHGIVLSMVTGKLTPTPGTYTSEEEDP